MSVCDGHEWMKANMARANARRSVWAGRQMSTRDSDQFRPYSRVRIHKNRYRVLVFLRAFHTSAAYIFERNVRNLDRGIWNLTGPMYFCQESFFFLSVETRPLGSRLTSPNFRTNCPHWIVKWWEFRLNTAFHEGRCCFFVRPMSHDNVRVCKSQVSYVGQRWTPRRVWHGLSIAKNRWNEIKSLNGAAFYSSFHFPTLTKISESVM